MSFVHALNSYIRSPYLPKHLGQWQAACTTPLHSVHDVVFASSSAVPIGIIIKQNNYQKLGEPAIMLTNPFSQVHPAFRMLLPQFPLCHLSMSLMQICYTMTVYMSYNAYNCG